MARIFILKQKFTDKGKLALLHEFLDEQCSFNIQVFLAATSYNIQVFLAAASNFYELLKLRSVYFSSSSSRTSIPIAKRFVPSPHLN